MATESPPLDEELEAILGHKVDLFSGLNRWLEPLVRQEMLPLYEHLRYCRVVKNLPIKINH